MPRFTIPRDIHYGRESIGLLSTIRGKRAMLVTVGGEMKQRGILSRAETALRRTGMEVRLLEANNLEHVEQAVAEGASAMRAFAPDWIVALGSMAIDAAKLMWILYEYPEAALSDLHLPFSLPDLRRKARFAAIPSLGGGAPGGNGVCGGWRHGGAIRLGCGGLRHRAGCDVHRPGTWRGGFFRGGRGGWAGSVRVCV